MAMIVGVDGGNNEVKVACPTRVFKFLSNLGEYRERRLDQVFSEDDMIVEYNGKKRFAGTLAKYESEFVGSMMGSSKAHEDFLYRVLIALHKCEDLNFKVIVGQPIISHIEMEKRKMKDMLIGEHLFTVNDIDRNIVIEQAEVAAEGGAAFWSNPVAGLVHILDIGSGTVNAATLDEGRYIDKMSFTLKFGMSTNYSVDMFEMARAIASSASKKWSKNAKVLLVGGGAESLLAPLTDYFSDTTILKPKFMVGTLALNLRPVYANAVGFYNIGRKVYG